MICLVGKRVESFSIVILRTWVTLWSESPSSISPSEAYKRSGSDMTPRQEFNDLWGVTVKLESKNVFASKKDFVWRADMVSINKSPERNFFTDFGFPPIP
ncbi:hypothetical protein TNCV_3693371 [Trichonephila clavipes]|nr:hypothetical protein TNCV_3693371 [Trichonephila clavipes]